VWSEQETKMIDSITGIIQRKEPTNLFIDMNGMVFNISICLRDYEELPDLNQEITILTYLNVREDLMELYGFLEYERRRLFTQLIGVSGIGPRTAINLLSNISVANFKENIIAEDVKSLSLIPGIGPKTAKRIILDIREKVTKDRATTDGLDTSNINFTYDDIYTALSSLGYRKNQIDKAIKQLTKENSFEGNIEHVIKRILNIIR
jgi:Holliday junction DNA helicase RuvA